MRARPRKLLDAFSDAGILISTLYLMFLAVSIIDFCLKLTGLPFFISLDVLQWLQGLDLGAGGSVIFQFMALGDDHAAGGAARHGDAGGAGLYVNVALLDGTGARRARHLDLHRAHVHLLLSPWRPRSPRRWRSPPSRRARSPRRSPWRPGSRRCGSGIVIFVIPFVFAVYPELLLIEEAVVDPTSTGAQIAYLPGYDGSVELLPLLWLLARLVLALYLLASALARFDRAALPLWEIGLRLALAVLVISSDSTVYGPAIAAAALWIAWHGFQTRRKRAADEVASGS